MPTVAGLGESGACRLRCLLLLYWVRAKDAQGKPVAGAFARPRHSRVVSDVAKSPHLTRLRQVWHRAPVYFVTCCTQDRRRILASPGVHQILREEWSRMAVQRGWLVGRYVVMPDHVHFFVSAAPDAGTDLALAIGKWKEWTAKRMSRSGWAVAPVWQREFFDHLLRSADSKDQKWSYVVENPVRAGLVRDSVEWPYRGFVHFD